MEDQPPKTPQITEKRQRILDKAFEVMRKARGQMDPAVIHKIRRMIASSPEIMKKLGVEDDLKPKQSPPPASKADNFSQKKQTAAPKQTQQPQRSETDKNETINQQKNMEVMAKLLALKPQGKDKIIETIKKASK